jgi:hypothetical protein
MVSSDNVPPVRCLIIYLHQLCNFICDPSGGGGRRQHRHVSPQAEVQRSKVWRSRGVVVSVLATGPKGGGFKPGRGD